MKHKMIFVLLALLILTACATPTVTPPTAVPPTAAVQPTVAATPVSIKIAMLPILDALPFYVAQEKGYFNDQKLKVEFVPVA
ncbi:MAG: ABC transporter substrate-binding protein, partial [Chloroflexota bacterium]